MYNSALAGYLGPSEFRVASATATTSVVVSYYFQQLSSQKIKPREVVVSSEVVRLGEEEEALGGRDVLGRP